MKRFKCHFVLVISIFFMFSATVNAQQESEKKEDKPVRDPFESSVLVESQTVLSPSAKALEMVIHHRFGPVDNGFSDLAGIYAPSNIRLGLQYGITDKIMIGFGTEKNNKMQEFVGKYLLLEQTRSGKVPVSLSVYANAVIDARDETVFGVDYQFMDRMSYFAQIIVARKFSKAFSLQLAPSYSHFNAVDRAWQHDKIGVMIGGRYKFTRKMGVMFEYHHPININTVHDYQNEIQPGAALGLEIGTSTHAFQVFATNYEEIVPQANYVMNTNKLDAEGIRIGFNITVRF